MFLFEDEVEPILSVLCGKTLEIARMEVLQEEEISEMKRQQESFATMKRNEEKEISSLEEAEQKRLDAYQAKKNLERSKRETKKQAHKKVVSRALAKNYTSQLKINALTYLRDVGYFKDVFEKDVLHDDVMPWLYEQTGEHVGKLESHGGHSGYTTSLIGNYVATTSDVHSNAVKAYAEKIKARRAAEKQAAGDKIAAKLKRKKDREAKRKAEAIQKLVDKAHPVDEILKQEITDIDGWSQDQKPVVTAIGGWLGQLMIVLNTVAKYYPQLDRPVKTGRSNRSGSRRKSQASGKSGGAKSQKSGAGDKSEG